MYFSYVYSNDSLNDIKNGFKKLSVNPFEYFISINTGIHDSITENDSPAGKGGKMSLTAENAIRIVVVHSSYDYEIIIGKYIEINKYIM